MALSGFTKMAPLALVAVLMICLVDGQTVDLSGCGTTKGCYRNPGGCTTSCSLFMTWVLNGNNKVDIEMGGTLSGAQKYISIGFSNDKQMGDDSVIDCIDNGGTRPIIQMSYNRGQLNDKLNNPAAGFVASSLEGSFTNGQLLCRMTRTITTNTGAADSGKIFDLNKAYNLLLAKGQYIGSTKVDHGNAFWSTSTKYNIAKGDTTTDAAGTGGNPLIAVHGIFMVIAWMISCGVAIILPRYFKDAWPGKKLGGKPIWIQLHQALMIVTLILNVIAFILIFIDVKGYATFPDTTSSAHPPLGIITTILVIANPIMAFLRPDPGTSKRVIFYWAHFVVGELAHIFAVVTIFLAMYMTKSNVPAWGVWIMVIYIVFHCLTELGLALHKHLGEKKNATGDMKMDDDAKEKGEEPQKGMDKKSMIKTILLVIYAFVVIVLSIVLIVPISQA